MLVRVNDWRNCAALAYNTNISGVVLTRLMPGHYQDNSGQKKAVEALAACYRNLARWQGKIFLCINYSPAFNKNNRWSCPQDLLEEFRSLLKLINELLPHLNLSGVCLVGEFLRKADPCFNINSANNLFVEARRLNCQIAFTEYNAKEISPQIIETARDIQAGFVGQLYSDKASPRKFAEAKALANLESCGIPLAYVEAAGFAPFNNPFAESYAFLIQKQIRSAAYSHIENAKNLLCWWNAFPNEVWIPKRYQGQGRGVTIFDGQGNFNSFGKKLAWHC